MTLAQIAKALGLPEGATLEDIIAALKLPEGATVGDVIAAIVAAGDAGAAAAAPPPAPAASAAPAPAPAPEKVPAAAPVDPEKIAASAAAIVRKQMIVDACEGLTPLERKAAMSLSPSEAAEFVAQRVKANAVSAPNAAHADEAAIAAVAKATGHSVAFVKGVK